MRKTDDISLCFLKHLILPTLLSVKVLWAGDSGGRVWDEVGMGGVGSSVLCFSWERDKGAAEGCGIPGATPGCWGPRVPIPRPPAERLQPALPPPPPAPARD